MLFKLAEVFSYKSLCYRFTSNYSSIISMTLNHIYDAREIHIESTVIPPGLKVSIKK